MRVRVGESEATARARRVTSTVGSRDALAPALRAALGRAGQLLGRPVPITSGVRSAAEQRRLWHARAANPYPVAPPGTSRHERGLAIDVPASFADSLAGVAAKAGLCRPYPRTDPVHFELC